MKTQREVCCSTCNYPLAETPGRIRVERNWGISSTSFGSELVACRRCGGTGFMLETTIVEQTRLDGTDPE